jgi:hypothetical protein
VKSIDGRRPDLRIDATEGVMRAALAEEALREAIRGNLGAHELMAALGRMGVFGKLEGGAVRWSVGWGAGLSAAMLQAISAQAAGIKAILTAAARDRRERTSS